MVVSLRLIILRNTSAFCVLTPTLHSMRSGSAPMPTVNLGITSPCMLADVLDVEVVDNGSFGGS